LGGAPGTARVRATERRRPVRQASLALQTEQILRDRLHDGELAPGDRLPPEHELASEFGVSRATVRAAITGLVRRGLVVQHHGVGNFVAVGTQLTNNLSEAVDLTSLLQRNELTPEIVFDEVAITQADHHVAEALRLDDGAPILESSKRFIADDTTLIYVVNSIPVAILGDDLAADVVQRPEATEPLFQFLEESAGVSTSSQLARIEAELGTDVDHPAAHLAADVPVLRLEEVGYTAATTPIWHSHSWYPPGSMSFELIRHRTGALS
jgi:GntR family transcriptional regulator